ncbi:MAG: Bro-N domain-containing protein [Nanoarchaeota archaeon]|nr:Bro-N domain-containing protein [Nanoarchaeota archaeon]MBU1269461.1 Bro-N domain-containing protein [Nanoarchaeota archaeon]MBU1604519.1 Bro-N domain-containing protein [Nanoarchaeota archaeon]MBU2443458.1 Bro-N domain-containing protein [Nanoarchaeota archaeon]
MNEITLFGEKQVRRVRFHDEWWFVIKDVVSILTESVNPSDYLKKLRKRDESLSDVFKGGGQIVPPLGMEFDTAGGRQMLQCWNTTGILRLIQSIPSKNAEPFKRWLAKVGKERIDEIENPELAQERMKEIYSAKGYPKDWIDKRLRGIAIRQNLTDEWEKRGIETRKDFAILTAEISKATFGMTPSEYKQHKNLPKQSKANLRDHMNDLELIFTMLGERVTTELSEDEKPDSFKKSEEIAKKGGKAAGDARKSTEKQLNRTIISKKNYLENSKNKKLK